MGGATAVIVSALRFRELTKRFFAIRLIFFLALTNLAAALFFIVHAVVALEGLESGALLCEARAMGKFYFSAASIMWTSCFAFTLYRDLAPSYRRHALRKVCCLQSLLWLALYGSKSHVSHLTVPVLRAV